MNAVTRFPSPTPRRDHWSDAFLGLPFHSCDCVALCGRVAEFMGHKPTLPKERPSPTPWAYSQELQMMMPAYLTPVEFAPLEGDVALMKLHGRLSHVGIYCEPSDIPSILHTDQTHGSSVRVPINRLRYWQITIEGFYRWRK